MNDEILELSLNKEFNDAAKSIHQEINPAVAQFDPMTIMAIIGLLFNLYKMYQECKKNDWHIIDDAKSLNTWSWNPFVFWKRRRLKNIINALENVSGENKKAMINGLPAWVVNHPAIITNTFDIFNKRVKLNAEQIGG